MLDTRLPTQAIPARHFSIEKAPTTLFTALLDAARTHGAGKEILEDAERQPLTYRKLILASLVLGAKIDARLKPGHPAGVLLPNVNGLAVTLFGLNAFGRPVALLNFTAGPRNITSAARTSVIETVVTSRRFVDTAKLDEVVDALSQTEYAPGKRISILYLEDLRKQIGTFDKLTGAVRALAAPLIYKGSQTAGGKPAVILFTSGTEGAPKAVVLTNANLIANARQIAAVAADHVSPADVSFNPLPMFHSFGLTAGTLWHLFSGRKVVLYPSPLHYKQIPKLISDTGATMMLATDTFLQGYARAAAPGELDGIRLAIAGAERLKDQTRQLWRKMKAELMEGYGATECSPVLACNLPSASREGSVGRLLPGLEVRLDPVPGIADGGKLVVRGPNVMAGYMLADKPGILVPPEGGWHDTGDIVTIDDGFVTIRGRAKRFAKIGGEMVSLAAIEALASGLWVDSSHVAISMPDPRKGESLVLVTDEPRADKAMLLEHARTQGFPELWVPKSILVVGSIPVLGSGKVDIPATTEMVKQTRPLL